MHKYFLTLAVCAAMVATQFASPALAAPAFGLSLTATPASFTGPCPAKINLDGKIVNLPPTYVPTAQYSLLNSDGIDSAPMTATFDATHHFAVHDARTPSMSGAYWVQLQIHLGGQVIAKSEPARFVVKCTNVPNPNGTLTLRTPVPYPSKTPCAPGIAANIPCQTPPPKPTATPCVQTAATANLPCKTPSPLATHCPPTIACPTPNPQVTPCKPTADRPCKTPSPQATPCHNAAGVVTHCKQPDLTAGSVVTVGGHPTHWGAGVTLTYADSLVKPRPYCAFNIVYTLANIGLGNAGPPDTAAFKNVIRVDGATVSIQSALSQAASTHRVIMTQAYLPLGVHTLTLDIDDGNAVTESNEANNHFAMKYQLTGDCKKNG